MKRKFKVVLNQGIQRVPAVSGVYMMNFGHSCFYIGRSVDIARRAYQHKIELEKMFDQYGDNPQTLPSYHYKYDVFNHLLKAPTMHVLSFDLLDTINPLDFISKEQKWLDEACLFPNCLNMGFTSKLSSGEVKKINLENK